MSDQGGGEVDADAAHIHTVVQHAHDAAAPTTEPYELHTLDYEDRFSTSG